MEMEEPSIVDITQEEEENASKTMEMEEPSIVDITQEEENGPSIKFPLICDSDSCDPDSDSDSKEDILKAVAAKEKDELKCNLCGKEFSFLTNVKRHLLSIHGSGVKCHHCTKTFSRKDGLKRHLRGLLASKTMEMEEPSIVDITQEEENASSIKFPEQIASPARCDPDSDSKENILQAAASKERNITEKNELKCNLCGKEFSFRSNVKRHLLSVHGSGVQCHHCTRTFSRKEDLTRHLKGLLAKAPSKKKLPKRRATPARCVRNWDNKEIKLKPVALAAALDELNITGKELKCKVCGKKFSLPCNVKRHLLSVHGSGVQCHHCTRTFSRMENLKRHLRNLPTPRTMLPEQTVSPAHCVPDSDSKENILQAVALEENNATVKGRKTIEVIEVPDADQPNDNVESSSPTMTTSPAPILNSQQEGDLPEISVKEKWKDSSLKGRKTRKVVEVPDADKPSDNRESSSPKTTTNPALILNSQQEDDLPEISGKEKLEDASLKDADQGIVNIGVRRDEQLTDTSAESVEIFQCSVCQNTFKKEKYLKRHYKTHTKPFTCDGCEKTFATKFQKDDHFDRIHRNEKNAVCDICGFRAFSSRLIHFHIKHVHEKVRGKRQRYSGKHICCICSRSCQNAKHLLVHYRSHTGEKPYKCPLCPKRFSKDYSLKTHTRIHDPSKDIICDVCGKHFKTPSFLKGHMVRHGEKQILCEICDKKFWSLTSLKYHLLVHTKEKPYSCDICQKKFSRSDNLKKHLRMHTNETPYVCKICQKGFYNASNLKTHMKMH